jgi:hypothetical protein
MKRVQKNIILADLMPQVIRTRIGKRYWDFYLLSSAWHEVVGEHIAARARPAWIKKDTLWLYVNAPVWSQEIQLIKPELLGNIRQYFPDAGVEDIRCLQESAKVSKKPSLSGVPEPAPDIEAKKEQILKLTQTLPDTRAGGALYAFWKKVHGIGE